MSGDILEWHELEVGGDQCLNLLRSQNSPHNMSGGPECHNGSAQQPAGRTQPCAFLELT